MIISVEHPGLLPAADRQVVPIAIESSGCDPGSVKNDNWARAGAKLPGAKKKANREQGEESPATGFVTVADNARSRGVCDTV